jgi:hypothetical protein
MRKIVILGIVAIGILFSQIAAMSQDEASKPSYKNADTWLFTVKESGSIGSSSRSLNGSYELAIVNGKLQIAQINGSQKEELDPRPTSLVGLLAFSRNLDFPLTIGKTWTLDYKGTYVGGSKSISRRITYEVKGVEQVTTPAGTFRAFKLESDDRSGPRDYFTTTYWYSPQTRSIVKSLFDASAGGQNQALQREIELIKVTPAN